MLWRSIWMNRRTELSQFGIWTLTRAAKTHRGLSLSGRGEDLDALQDAEPSVAAFFDWLGEGQVGVGGYHFEHPRR